MNTEKQKLLLSYLVGNHDLFIKVQPILEEKYFDLDIKKAVAFMKKYFHSYKGLPTPGEIYAETKVAVELPEKPLTKPQVKYAEAELESFCRTSAIINAVATSFDLIEQEKYGEMEKLIKDAITISLQRDLGTDYFENPELRLQQLVDNVNMVATGIRPLDEALGGGCNRREMTIFAAPSGVGKSITMANVTRNFVIQGLHGVYITLELSEEIVAKRFDSMFSGIGQLDIFKNITKTSIEVKRAGETAGTLLIKRMPESTTTANHIRAYLKEYEIVHGRTPDFLAVDYLDIMASVEHVSVENMFVKDKYVAEELRALANEYNLIMLTASQLNRGAQQIESLEDLNQGHIAGGLSKINTTDNLVAIIQTAQMKARGELMFKMLKTRSSNGVGMYFLLKFNTTSLRLLPLDSEAEQDKAAFKQQISTYGRSAANAVKAGSTEPSITKTPKLNGLDLFKTD
jgi:KaiC/GvpD/RAD55 family RecA-like ATPase